MPTDLSQIAFAALEHAWPIVRIGCMFMVMPAIGSHFVPAQVRVLMALAVTLLVGPIVSPPEITSLFSLETALLLGSEVLLGIASGFILTLVLDAVLLGGQTIAMSMGLGFAVFLDRSRGVNVPVLGQVFMVLATLIFLALNGHLEAIETIVEGFQVLPIGSGNVLQVTATRVLEFSTIVFIGAIQIALPAVTALLVANLAFGVMSRAAPTLNLFAVGFPTSLLFGLVVIYLSMDGFTGVVSVLIGQGLSASAGVFSVGGAP